ncbi:MAG TPA: glycerol-3-phosphate dehydrogenase/oxidase [Anaerolineales bacterium]|nr:glycerol-3-phosphate dehydrogenase/oxidase [Anaerolineales bacterium]
MWKSGWRDRVWADLDRHWDVIVIGGGITGAGILREAARAGLRALLVEAADFASGTSSRSSKLVHGGLRYLKNGEIKLTIESVRERERLLKEGRGLITQLGFLLPNFAADRPPAWVFGLGLTLYDLLAMRFSHRHYDAEDMRELCPSLTDHNLLGGYRYFDAQTDDARLVLRVIGEAVRAGGAALNYARVESLLRLHNGQVQGVALRDGVTGRTAEIKASVVINATGAWADDLRAHLGRGRRLRRLRGSHLILPAKRIPLRRAISFLHPVDRRPIVIQPWEGVTLFGTTDVEHGPHLESDSSISAAEVDYLLTALRYAFPALALETSDVLATLAGVRGVLDTGQADPSKESREHVLWSENGLLTVTGGKLTTFRLMAHDALNAARAHLPSQIRFDPRERVLDASPAEETPFDLNPALSARLIGRYGVEARQLIAMAQPGELESIGDTPSVWAEVRWAARAEGVIHLDDLLLRRVRLGLLLPNGGLDYLDHIRAIAQPELGWDDEQWTQEVVSYSQLWKRAYSMPL